jgi:hypothetical protein
MNVSALSYSLESLDILIFNVFKKWIFFILKIGGSNNFGIFKDLWIIMIALHITFFLVFILIQI